MTLRIFNSLTRRLEPLEPIVPGHVGMYVCGMTIYDLCHIGHARFLIAFDLVYRWLQALGFDVTYVRNITDIDDKIIRRATERGTSMRALTDEMTAAMHADLAALGLLPPTLEPRATDHVLPMLDMIGALERNGLAYRTTGGDVNFAVRKFAEYGRLSGKSIDELRSGERVAVAEGKDDPLDFVLWKATKPDEPDEARWESQYGSGRPGWHIECSAMACALLGTHFDIHGGGIDLQFPHHENELAQSVGANRGPFVNVWMHNGHLNVDGQKMSKSLGNFVTIRDVLAEHDGETLRYAVLRNHYRSPYNYTSASLADARGALRRLYTALDGTPPPVALPPIDWATPAAAAFGSAMNDDFNTPVAVAVLFDLAGEVNRQKSTVAAGLLKALGGTLGLLQQPPRRYLQGGTSGADDAVERLIIERAAAKQARDFARADAIRGQLAAEGVSLQDSAAGTTWSRA